jgi:bacteriocin biosynthesis cyclodehydratase domain-containing protein
MVRPGLKILRRDPRTLQLGLDWPGVAALPDTEPLRAVLAAVDGFRDTTGVVLAASQTGLPIGACEEALVVLLTCGALVDSVPSLHHALSEPTVSALWLLAGPERGATDIVSARERCSLWVHGTGVVADCVRGLAASAGLRLCRDLDQATVGVLAGDREPARGLADAAMHSGIPHLWVYVRDLVGVIGPFVTPGTTACLRCVDAARTATDPAWPTLLQSAESRPLRVAACDEVHSVLVGAWAVQEIAMWASDIRPPTQGQVIEVPMGWSSAKAERFEPHPACGCSWARRRATIGA